MRQFGTALILSGGKSSRMGFDKQLLQIRDRNIIDHIVSQIQLEFDDIVIVSNRPELYADSDYRVVPDEIKGMGPLSGIHVGLRVAKSRYVYVIACDMPIVNLAYIRYMKEELGTLPHEVEACITRFGEWIEPFNSFYHRNLITPIINHFADDQKMINTLIKQRDCHYIAEDVARKFSPDWDMFLNLNTQADLEQHLTQNELTTLTEITKYRDGVEKRVVDEVIIENPLTIFINGEEQYTLYCTPQALPELVYGSLFAEGMISRQGDVAEVLILKNQNRAFVTLTGPQITAEIDAETEATVVKEEILQKCSPFNHEVILSLMAEFNSSSDIFKRTGAVHSCALVEEDQIIVMHEDIGRHNALDKMIGTILLNDIDPSGKMLLASGRITLEMLTKATMIGIKTVISRSASTNLAIEMARDLDITLIGFVRGARMNIYHLSTSAE